MSETSKRILHSIISETECSNLLESKNFQTIVRLKVFNGESQTDLDRTVIFSIESISIDEIKKCMEEIRKFNYPWAKSFHSDTTINEEYISLK
jgi:hypothetical protein